MGKSFHSGMIRLREKWQEFRSLPFPEVPQDEYLGELFAELVLIDTHIAGIVSSFIAGKKVDKKFIYIEYDFSKKLNNYIPVDPKSQNIIIQMKVYKKKLDDLVNLVLELYDE